MVFGVPDGERRLVEGVAVPEGLVVGDYDEREVDPSGDEDDEEEGDEQEAPLASAGDEDDDHGEHEEGDVQARPDDPRDQQQPFLLENSKKSIEMIFYPRLKKK